MVKVILDTNRTGYGTDQISRTMTVGELIEALSRFDEDTPIYTGHDRQRGSWYTYGGIEQEDLIEIDEEEDE